MDNFGTAKIYNSSENILNLILFDRALKLFEDYLKLYPEDADNYRETKLIIEKLNKILGISKNNTFSAKGFDQYWDIVFNEIQEKIVNFENNSSLHLSELNRIVFLLDRVLEFLKNYLHNEYLNNIKIEISTAVKDIEKGTKRVTSDIEKYNRLRDISDNQETEYIYNQAVNKYRDLENDYRRYFFWALGLTVGISLGTFFLKKIMVPDFLGNLEFWVLKASIIVVGITLITYFLKQSTHYQRLADQNYQTQIELQAYPSFMESIPKEEAASVRKELALKYFGREIDGSVHKDMGNLISDQIKSTTEMVKATTDVLKVRGGNNGG